MGAQASRNADAESAPGQQDEQLTARAWRTGVPFTLLHDESFVMEKYQEIVAALDVQTHSPKTPEDAQTTASGLDESTMDEMHHATDMARIKLFARTKREERGDSGGSRPASPSKAGATSSTLGSSTSKDNPPSALAGMVGNILSRESPESVENEKLRVQRDQLLQVYFEQIGARLKLGRVSAELEEKLEERSSRRDSSSILTEGDGILTSLRGPGRDRLEVGERCKILEGVTAASLFSVGSLRMQLEMLREFRALSPRLFENGTMALVQTFLDYPPFVLQEVDACSPENALVCDIHKFCSDVLRGQDGGQEVSQVQRQIVLLLLLSVGVSSGRISLLLEFVDELPHETASTEALVQGYSFSAWVNVFMQRMQSYRIDYALGTFEDRTFAKKFSVKTLPGEDTSNHADNDSQRLRTNFSSSSLATDGSFAYIWSLEKGLAKVGTGLNFTIAGRVYAEVPASEYLQVIEEKRDTRKLIYGFGEDVKDVSDVARKKLSSFCSVSPSNSPSETVLDVFGEIGDQESFTVPKLLISFRVGHTQDMCVLGGGDAFALPAAWSENGCVDVIINRAWYGSFDILSAEALLSFRQLVDESKTDTSIDDDEGGVTLTRQLLEELITLSGISLGNIVDSKKLMVMFACGGDGNLVGAQVLQAGDQFVAVEKRCRDSYYSSLVYCDDSLYLNVMYPELDTSGWLIGGASRRCHQLLRISSQDLGFLEALPLKSSPPAIQIYDVVGNSARPLYVYVTEGKTMYEIEFKVRTIGVSVISPKTAPGGGKDLLVTRQFTLSEKSELWGEFALCLANLRTILMNPEGSLEMQVPSFYTNGALLGMLILNPSSLEHSSSKDSAHCVLFDCETGQRKEQNDSGKGNDCQQRSLPRSSSVCFDARNNFLWLYDANTRVLRSFQNSGKRIPLDENLLPSGFINKKLVSQNLHVDDLSFGEVTIFPMLSFIYKNAIASDPEGGPAGGGSGLLMRVPFAVDVEVKTFELLLNFISKYVDVFKANRASIVEVYSLQACLGILNKNLERLLMLPSSSSKSESLTVLKNRLSAPLDKLLEFSAGEVGFQKHEIKAEASSTIPKRLNVDERSRLQVASVALDLYTTSIRVFNSDVSKQFAHVLKYLQLWQQSKATRMELKILARLLSHLCTRVEIIYESMAASDDALGQFLRLVEFAVEMQQRQLRFVCSDQEFPIQGFENAEETSFELISLINAITQTAFVAFACAGEAISLDVAIVVFDTMRDACSSICSDLVDQIKQRECQSHWLEIDKVLQDGFVGILTPVILSSGVALLRNHKSVTARLSLKDKGGSNGDERKAGLAYGPSRLIEFLKENSSKLLKFMASLDVLVSMIHPSKRENIVENVSMTLKTETMESSHEYENNMDALTELQFPGAARMVITFDPRSRTEVNYDYLTFCKDKSQGEYYGSQFYSGRDSEFNWPGVGDNPPLIIESDHCFVYFHTDGSNTDWGYKFTATAEMLERKKSLQQHWIVFLLESVAQMLDETIKLLIDGSALSPIEEIELLNERYLQSDLLKSGVCALDSKNAEVLQLLQDFVDPPESSNAEKVIQALQTGSSATRPGLALARSSSFDLITSSAPNKYVNSAVRAVAAAIFHHNMWGMDAYAFTHNLRDDISEQLLRGWKNAQKMRDWFHLGDAADAGIHGMLPNRRRSGRLRRQPSAYKGLSEESLAILCDNVIKRAQFLLEITPVSFAYVTGAKRRWGLLAKYGHAIGNHSSSDNQLDKWYNLLDDLQAATELRSLFEYRRLSSERIKHGQMRSVTEQVLEFIQSDADIVEMRKVLEIRNQRAATRALGMEIFIQSLNDCQSVRLRGILLESFATTLKSFALANSPTNVASAPSLSVSTLDTFPRLHFDALLSGCDQVLRQRIAEAFGNCLAMFAKQLASISDDGTSSGLITGILKCCAMDYDLEDSYLLQESRVLQQILRLLSSDSVPARNAAQSLLGVLLSRFIAGRVESDPEEDDGDYSPSDGQDVSVFQRQLFSAVGHQLEGIVSTVKPLSSGRDTDIDKSFAQFLPENSPGFTAPCLQRNSVSWNHSIMLWIYSPSKGPLYALKVGDEVRRGPNWIGADGSENDGIEVGTVISIPAPTKVYVRWNSSGLTSQCEFNPKSGIFDVVLVDEGVGGTIFFKGNKNMMRDTPTAKPWSHFGLFLTDKRMLVYKVACGSDKESVFETDCELDADQWSHVAIVQDEDMLSVYVNGSMVSQHLLEPFLVMNGNVNPAESAIIESAHPFEDSVDAYCPVHIPGAVKIRLTFDPLCDIDGSTGFVRFYTDAECVEVWGEDKYTGKYSDPERNFPGAQSNRARSLQQDNDVDQNVLEIPSDRFLVYFHNEGSSNSWGFRVLASPEFATSEDETISPVSHLNPYPFYFGEAPARVLDHPAAKCWIYEPKVLNYPISESDLTEAIQTSYPSSEIVSNSVPAERILHILGLIHTCAETSFGQSLIGTPKNLENLMFLSFDDRVPVEVHVGSIRVLKELTNVVVPDIMDVELGRALPRETDGFLPFLFKRLARALNVWQSYDDDRQIRAPTVENENDGAKATEEIIYLRNSAQGQTSLVAAYVSILRQTAGCSCWVDQLFELVVAGLKTAQGSNKNDGAFFERVVGPMLASLAILGGNYSGAYIGGRVSCCVNVDGKEMIETGYLVQFRMKSGGQIARVIFDCDQTSTVDVPLTDVEYLDDIEKEELGSFLQIMASSASELKDLYQGVLDLTINVSQNDELYQPKLTENENVEVLESEHPYAAGENVTYSLNFRGSSDMVVRFDKMSCTAGPNDYIQFKKREADLQKIGNEVKYWGEEKYYGESFPGVGATPPLRIPTGCVDVHFYTESTSSTNSEWGFKLTAHAFQEAMIYPPELPPTIVVSALHDIRARCIKSLGQIMRSQTHSDTIATFAPLLSSLAKIANAPCDGRPIHLSPKSQIFESKHPYANSVMEYMKVTFSGASTLTITFDSQSRTEHGCDYLCFFKDKSLTERWGAYQYCGVGSEGNWPGTEDRPPLVIPSDSFTLLWTTDGSNVDWGWKFNVTADFGPEYPLDKNLKQLDARCYRLFETLYEKMNHQRIPLKSEFKEFAETSAPCNQELPQDPVRQLLSEYYSSTEPELAVWGSTASKRMQCFRVTDENGVKVYTAKDRESSVSAELTAGVEFFAEIHPDGWLHVLEDETPGWIWQRTEDMVHVTSLVSRANGEDLLTLGVDDLKLENKHSVLEMDESNDEEKSLTSLCSPFAFDDLKGQTDRIQSLACDTYHAMATKAARDAILTFLSCDPARTPVPLRDLGDAEDILLLLSRFFPESISVSAYDNQSGVLLALRKRLKSMVLSGSSDAVLSKIITQSLQILSIGPILLPTGRGALRILESVHPYPDNSDQYWDISIPGATRIKVIFDRRCKSEAGCDWLRFYKSGSNRTETIGPDQIGGRKDTENWPGTGGRPPLYIDADSFEVYFHSDSSNNDWGFKFYAIGIFTDEERTFQDPSGSEMVIRLLSMVSWILDTMSSVPDADFRSSSIAFKTLYSAMTLQTLTQCLDDSPQCIKTQVLQVIGNLSQSSAFHTIPAILIEQVRDLVNVKLRAKYEAENRLDLKSSYLQKLVQCAVSVDLSIDSHCFGGLPMAGSLGTHITVPYEPAKEGVSTFVSDPCMSLYACYQFQLVFNRLVSVVSVGLMDRTCGLSANDSVLFVQWQSNGEVSFRSQTSTSEDDNLVEISGHKIRICEGDSVIIQLDVLRQTLVFRKNGIVAALIVGPVGSGALVSWEDFRPSLNRDSDIRLVISHSSSENRVEFSSFSFSPIVLIPQSIIPSWYRKVVDAVAMMMDFRDNTSPAIISKESRHPLVNSTTQLKPKHERIEINGALALEIRFDTRTKLQLNDEVRFFCGNQSSSDSDKPLMVLSGINGEVDENDSPHLFASENLNSVDYSLSVGDLVVRSPDWEYSDEDGGAGNVGIVQEITAWKAHTGKGVRIRWQENEFENLYRYGLNGRYDVQNLRNTKYHDAPLIIPGNTFSYEFVPSISQATSSLDLSITPEFLGSLELDGSSQLGLKVTDNNECVTSDVSIEFWACISEHQQMIMEDQSDSVPSMEVFRIDTKHGRVVLLCDALGQCALDFQQVNGNEFALENRNKAPIYDMSTSGNLVFGQWMHLALVFSGSRVFVSMNGAMIYSALFSEYARSILSSNLSLNFGSTSNHTPRSLDHVGNPPQCIGFQGHLYDIRIWDVAFRVEQLRSHFRGLESVEVPFKLNSSCGTPTNYFSPSMTFLSSPRSPRSSPRPGCAVPPHLRKWMTTNRSGKEVATVRLNCCVKLSPSIDENAKPNVTVYYEAHAQSTGKMCVGWVLDGAIIGSRSTMIGEEHDSFGIDLGAKVAQFSSSSLALASFTRIESVGCSSPRRSRGGNSFTNDIFCRSGDVIGCAINLATGKLTFYVNGTVVAEYRYLSANSHGCVGNPGPGAEESTSLLIKGESEVVVNETPAVKKPSQLDSKAGGIFVRSFYPSASLGPQGAQGVAWNFGQRPFKFEPVIEGQEVMDILQASGCEEEDAYFEVYDHDEHQWSRVVYRHKVQDITPRLVGWWKLNEGEGNLFDDASGHNQQGILVINDSNIDERSTSAVTQIFQEGASSVWWDKYCSPPAVARRRTGDGNNGSSLYPFPSSSDAANGPESYWGYKFYVIPHFSADTVGRRRFQSHSIRFSDCSRNLLPRHDQQLIKYINKQGQNKNLSVTQMLHGSWNDIAPQENELVRWPALMEVVSFARDDMKSERVESTRISSSRALKSSAPAKAFVDSSGRLSKRFKVLQEFNAAIHRILPFIAFHPPSLDADNQFLLSRLVMEQRHRILSVVKRTVWDNALECTNEPGVSFELTLNRPKAMRFRATGKADAEGRHTLFSQAFRQLQSLDGTHFRREDALYRVTFLGENAQDAGGPYRETFAQYCEELQSTQLPLMLPTPNSQHNVGAGREKWLLSPGAQLPTALQMLEFLGKLIGASIRSKQYLALNLAPLIWKKLAGERLGLDDLAAVDSMLVNSMSKMRTIDRYGVTEEMFEDIVMETFTTLGADNRVLELKPGGASLPVTFSSRCEYADLVEHARLHESDEQVQAIFRGIAKVVPAKLLACFSGAELELMVCGSPEVDVELLEKCTEYSSCSPMDDHIIWFWRALRDFSHEERSAFLRFVWGRSRLPASADEFPQRFKLQSFNQQRAGRSVDAYMPVAHTCFFSIELPAYSSEAVLREKLLYAIYNCQEIDGDGDSVAANQLGWEE